VSGTQIFDQSHYQALNVARMKAAREVLSDLKYRLGLETAIDVGCGLGYFSDFLRSIGFRVTAIDGRSENVAEASRRYPDIAFHVLDAESPALLELGTFDLVFCFGFLYHLENPFRVVRNLHALTSKLLLAESMVYPGLKPQMDLVDEGGTDDQGLLQIAFYPTETCLVKLMYRSGFTNVYEFSQMPEHPHFQGPPRRPRQRTALAASRIPLHTAALIPIDEPANPFTYGGSQEHRNAKRGTRTVVSKIRKFLGKSSRQKLESLRFRMRALIPRKPTPTVLPFGVKWLLENSSLDTQLRTEDFEPAESRFVAQFLRPGMTVLDVGAHHGFHTLLASLRVGREGKVISFEPSPRERKRLGRHIRFNKCKNVRVESFALGEVPGKSDFFLVDGYNDYCNSLRPPAVEERTRKIKVNVNTLDEYLVRSRIAKVDFIKIDVEGAEVDLLRGARKTLESGECRPVLLVEVSDTRTRPWGYRASDIINLLQQWRYEWFRLKEDGGLEPFPTNFDLLDSNFVAIPCERTQEILPSLVRNDKAAASYA
jgi:tRNA (mo5U34)-methyltransferase